MREGPARVRVDALDAAFEDRASELAERLGLPRDGEAEFALQIGSAGVQLSELGPQAPGPVRVDFVGGTAAHRRLYGGGAGQMIAKAVGLQPGVRPTVLDVTAGLGRDAFVLAELGCAVTMIERQPLIATLLEDGLRRAAIDAEIEAVAARMTLRCGDAIAIMREWTGEIPQVIYLDPMFPHRDKSALVKKEMRLFRPLVGDDDDAPQLLAAALELASHRVVVKRPRKAPAIAGGKPSYALEGKSSRYDVYARKSLKP
ncbi:class I SAM-dependent methyltransferase [Propionivibrio soli]|uniref:class I SAM-dependent methyltransferase n=1 Tax=Propionivibrio soli TaxID=2976531 RepID=UPI0021E6F35E|nr:class I SAM-dependent methyltransferase [Propionivibrio soli]